MDIHPFLARTERRQVAFLRENDFVNRLVLSTRKTA